MLFELISFFPSSFAVCCDPERSEEDRLGGEDQGQSSASFLPGLPHGALAGWRSYTCALRTRSTRCTSLNPTLSPRRFSALSLTLPSTTRIPPPVSRVLSLSLLLLPLPPLTFLHLPHSLFLLPWSEARPHHHPTSELPNQDTRSHRLHDR